MGKVRDQVEEQQLSELLLRSEHDRNKEMLVVVRLFNKLTIKGLAMDPQATETVIREAMREKSPTMPLTESLKKLFGVRHLEMARASVDLPRLQTMLDTRDSSMLGTNAKNQHVSELAQHLRNELNSLPMEKTVLDFLIQVNSKNVLGCTLEEWTLTCWQSDFAVHKLRTRRDHDPLISKLLCHTKENPSLADAARPDEFRVTKLVHNVAHNPLVNTREDMSGIARATVIACLLNGDDAGARAAVLAHRKESHAGQVFSLTEPDPNNSSESKDLSQWALDPMS